MTHRAQLAILALLIVLLLVFALFPRQAAGDAPVAATVVPAAEFEPVGSAGSLSGQATPGAPFQPRTLPVVGSPPILEKPAPSPSVRAVPSVAPVRTSAPEAVASASKAGHSTRGLASWFRSPRGVSAAGPALRTALGPGWRGRQVSVCAGPACITVVLGDWCACSRRVIDLDDNQFARLAPLSRGVVEVSVRW